MGPSESFVRRRFSNIPPEQRIERSIFVAFLLGLALMLSFALLADQVVEGHTAGFDRTVILAFRTVANPADLVGPPWVEEVGRDVTALGSYVFLGFVFVAVVGYLLLIRKPDYALLMTIAVLGGALLSTLLKLGFDRPRPDIVHAARVFTPGFPSGHATLSAATFLTIGALLTRVVADWRVKAYFALVAVFLTVMIGLSRLYLGVHYPTDVLAGWCAGAGWAVLCWAGALWLQRRGKVEPPS